MIGTYCTPLDAFKGYIAIRQHFKQKRYDIFKNGVTIRATQDQLDERNDKKFFYHLSENYLSGDLINFYMANIMSGREHPSEMEDVIHREYRARLDNMPYTFEQDMKFLKSLGYGIQSLFRTSNGKLPLALQALNGNHISLETICLINNFTGNNLLKTFDAEITDPLVWKTLRLKIVKYMGFVVLTKANLNKVNKIFLNYINE